MTMVIAVTAAVGCVLVPSRKVLFIGAVGLAVLVDPLLGIVVVGCGVAILQLDRIRRTRTRGQDTERDGVLAVELVGLGVTAGLPFRNAAALTADQIGGPVAREINQALRSVGAGQQALATTHDIQSMFSVAEASETTGMPLAGTLNAVSLDRRRADASASRERLAKLPVKMLFPLAFLILPGFVLLTVVPPLVSGLSKLGL